MIHVEKLESFNSQIRYYKNMLKYIENNKNPAIAQKNVEADIQNSLRNTINILINNINLLSLYIARFEEKSSNTELINEMLSSLQSVENIELIDENSDKKKQIRNCLAHADFKICIDESKCKKTKGINGIYFPYFEEEPFYLEIDNGKIKGKFTYTDFLKIAMKYYEIASAENKLYNLLLLPKDLRVKNNANIDKVLSDFEKVKIEMFNNSNLSESDTLKLFYNFAKFLQTNLGMPKVDTEKITEYMLNRYKLSGENDYHTNKVQIQNDEKELLKKYIKFIGIGVWDNKFNNQTRGRIISDIVSLDGGNYCNTMNSIAYSNLVGGIYDDYNNNEFDKLLMDLMFETPFLYHDMLLSYTNYCLGYAREVNKNSKDNEFFEFKDINLDGINPVFSNPKEKKEKIVEIFDEDLINKKKSEEENLYSNLKLIATKMKLLNANDKNPNKSKIIDSINQKTENIDVNYVLSAISRKIVNEDSSLNLSEDEILITLNGLMKEYQNPTEEQNDVFNRFDEILSKYCKKSEKSYPISDLSIKLQNINEELMKKKIVYKNSANFFRHMRNSLQHGNYSADYSKALDSKDFSKIVFTFEDIDKNEDKTINFKVSITAQRLYKLLEDFAKSVNVQIKDSGKEDELIAKSYIGFLNETHIKGIENNKAERRPTNIEFEERIGDEALISAINNSSIKKELMPDRDTIEKGNGEKDD